ncbi:hypothetical protein D8674_000396 [Pyrus ussuriensis x Pyrus communis]|uniref:Uncharacterized protein n=1 Tax=Pyrus ussuriensis x Pyrus communis TaxID=2448454 RepID=A0A5N5F3A2_9ROSA|nr:hypothetical protein D8674_000396 [Pyrus ussuriensis x Pyrus communis]
MNESGSAAIFRTKNTSEGKLINWLKKKLLHHSDLRRFSYRLKDRHQIDMFKEVYVRLGNDLAEQLHEVASQLPLETLLKDMVPVEGAGFQIMKDTLDQTLGRRLGNVHLGLGNACHWDSPAFSSRQSIEEVESLTSEVAGLNHHIAA